MDDTRAKSAPGRVRFADDKAETPVEDKRVEQVSKPSAEFKTSSLASDRSSESGTVTVPSRETQTVIESLRDNTLVEVRPPSAPPRPQIVAVDWLGNPLAPSTLPDFVTVHRRDFKAHDVTRLNDVINQHDVSRRKKDEREKEEEKGKYRAEYEQFEGARWMPRDTDPHNEMNGYRRAKGVVGEILPHPQASIWNVADCVIRRVQKQDPMEYLNLLDPHNKIPTTQAMYKWLIRDQAAMDERVVVGRCERQSGFTNNTTPYLPSPDDRNFRSLYKASYCFPPPPNTIEGLHPAHRPFLRYPGYGGATSMRDTPSAFLRFGPHALRTNPELDVAPNGVVNRVLSANVFS